MARFKHTGERLKQLQKQGTKKAKTSMLNQAERELGRSLKPGEIKDICKQADKVFRDLPVYGGE